MATNPNSIIDLMTDFPNSVVLSSDDEIITYEGDLVTYDFVYS